MRLVAGVDGCESHQAGGWWSILKLNSHRLKPVGLSCAPGMGAILEVEVLP